MIELEDYRNRMLWFSFAVPTCLVCGILEFMDCMQFTYIQISSLHSFTNIDREGASESNVVSYVYRLELAILILV